MIKGNIEQMTRNDMFNVYVSDVKKKLPFTVTQTTDVIKQVSHIFNIANNQLALYFNSAYIRMVENHPLLDIGYSPTEKLEIKNVDSKRFYFSLPVFNYTYSVNFLSNNTVFEVECYFAKEFFTVPENIFIEHQKKKLSDDQYIFEIENSEDKPFIISLKKGYQLYYCFFDHFHYVCLRDDSTLRELKDTLSSLLNVFFGVVYGEKIKEYFKISDPKEIDKLTTPISKLSKDIKIFDFDFDPKQEITPIPPFEISIEADKNPVPQSFNIESIDSSSTIYLITCILEKEFQIDRSLFIPYDQKGNKLELTSKIPINSKIKFRIEKPFNVKIGTENKQFSYLTTISDIKRIYNFKENNFGIIINKQFACHQSGKCYLSHFLKNSDNPDEATKIYFKRPISTCHIRSFKNLKTNKTKSFIVPDFFTLEKTVNFYLRKNIKSLLFLKENKNLNTFNLEYEFQNRATRNINIIFIDEDNKPTDSTIEVRGENPKIINLLFAIYQEKNGPFRKKFAFEKYSIFEASIKVNENPMKLHFMQLLSELSDDENNKITVKSYPYQKRKDDNSKTFTVRNNINGSSLEFKYDNISAKEIISKIKKQNNLEGENFNLYMEYNKLNPDDHPLICRHDQNYLIFNENKETKEFIISNGSPLKVPMTVSQKYFHEISDMIIGNFNIADLNNLKFRYLAYDRELTLPRNFDAGSLPDNCEISVSYIYTKSDYATFSYDGKTTKIQLSNIETPIYQLKREIQEKLNKYDMTLKSMSFSFYKAPLDEKREFTEYKITENSKISIVKSKDSFSITVRTPEKVSNVYEVTTSDTSTDIKELIKSQFCYDGEIQLLDERGRKLTKDQQLTPDMKLLLNCQKAEIQSEGTLGTKKHLINEILSIEEANKYLKTKLNNENISIFTINENDNSFEIVDPNKKLFEIETKLFVHQLFKIKSLYFGEHCIKINSDFNEISECNTVEWLKKNIISSKINSPPEYFQLSVKKRKIEENKMIYEVFNEDKPVQVKFIFENKTKESDEKPKSTKRYKPTISLLTPDDSNPKITKSRTQDNILKSKSERPKTKPKQRKMIIEEEEDDDENEGDENDSNNEELPEDFTMASKNISFSYRPKSSKKKITGNSNKEKTVSKKEKDYSDEDEKSDKVKEQSSSSEDEEKRESKSEKRISKKEKSDNSDEEKSDSDDEEKSDNDEEEKSESDKEELSSSEEEEEEKITYNIQIGREAVRTITLKKNATINDAKIKIAKEEDDIDPNCVSILFAGKNLKKTTVIEKLKLTKDDVLQVYIQNIEEILLRTAKALQVYGDGNVEENYSEYDEEEDF